MKPSDSGLSRSSDPFFGVNGMVDIPWNRSTLEDWINEPMRPGFSNELSVASYK